MKDEIKIPPAMVPALTMVRQEWHQKIWDTAEGVICPCCDRVGKVAKISISGAMARSLIWLHQNTRQGEYVHFNRTCKVRALVISASVGKLKYWGLVRQADNDDPKKKTSGYLAITEPGRMWARNQARVKQFAYVYNDECINLDGPEVSILDRLPREFDYRELMQPASG